MNNLIDDPYFDVQILSKTDRPNLLCYLAMHQCYAEKPITFKEIAKIAQLSESELGDRVVRHCLKFGHWSVIEHPAISFVISGYPHCVLGQITRHRLLSLSVQSQRYTGQRIVQLAERFQHWEESEEYYADCLLIDKNSELNEVFYFRTVNQEYTDRKGNKYIYTDKIKKRHLDKCIDAIFDYQENIEDGLAEEHARDLLPQNIRQNFVVTFNPRSLLHFCDLRLPADAQLEIRDLATRIFNYFRDWMPEVSMHYEKTRYGKNKLAP